MINESIDDVYDQLSELREKFDVLKDTATRFAALHNPNDARIQMGKFTEAWMVLQGLRELLQEEGEEK